MKFVAARAEERLVAGGDRLGAVRLGRRRQCVGAGRAGAGAGEAGEHGEAVVEDPGLRVGRRGGDVEGAAAGGPVEGGGAGGVDVGAGVGEHQARSGRRARVDLDDRRDRDRVADVVGAGEDVAVAAGGETALGRGADQGGGGAVGGAGVGVERALLARQRGGAKTRDRIGVVGAETDREGAVVVVALGAAGARRDGVDRQRAAGGCGGVGGEGEVGGGRAEQRRVARGNRLRAVRLRRSGECVGAGGAGAGAGEAGQDREAVIEDPGLCVGRRGGDVEGAAAGGAVEGGGAGGVHVGAGVGEHQARGGRRRRVDLDDRRDRDGVADVVGAGKDIAVAARGETALGRSADERGRGAVGRTGVGVQRALLTGECGGGETGSGVGVVGAEADGEGAVAVVALRAAAAGGDGVDRQCAADRHGRVSSQRKVGGGRAEQRLVTRGDRLRAVRLRRSGEGVGAGGAGAGAGEAGEHREAVVQNAGLGVRRAGGDVEGTTAGRAVEGGGAGGVHVGAGVGEHQTRSSRCARVDLDDRRDRDGIADVVDAGEHEAIAAGGETALGGGADDRRRGAVGRARVRGKQALLARQCRCCETRDRVGVVGAEADREGAVAVVALRATA